MATLNDPRHRPFRFGLLTVGERDATARQWQDQARQVEEAGFSTLLVGDHYVTPAACTARLAVAAAVTTTLRLGSYVYCNDFRHPALLAKDAAELDRLSDGRFELGMGAGWLKVEYDMVGLPFDEGRVRPDGAARRRQGPPRVRWPGVAGQVTTARRGRCGRSR